MKLLVKKIVSRLGETHFLRFRLLETRLLRIYIHNILKSDMDDHQHSHPWDFFSLILKGGYEEFSGDKMKTYVPGNIVFHKYSDFHKIKLISPTWTLVIAYGARKPWGFNTKDGICDNEEYRRHKNLI